MVREGHGVQPCRPDAKDSGFSLLRSALGYSRRRFMRWLPAVTSRIAATQTRPRKIHALTKVRPALADHSLTPRSWPGQSLPPFPVASAWWPGELPVGVAGASPPRPLTALMRG